MGKKQLKNKDRWRPTFILLVIFSPLILYMAYSVFKRRELLKNHSFETLAIIEYLAENKGKGSKSRKDIVYYRFQFGDSIIHTKSNEPSGIVSSLGLRIGDVYKIDVVKSDPNINELLYAEKVDTTFTFDPHLIHTYKSTRHKKIVNGEISF